MLLQGFLFALIGQLILPVGDARCQAKTLKAQKRVRQGCNGFCGFIPQPRRACGIVAPEDTVAEALARTICGGGNELIAPDWLANSKWLKWL